MEFPRGAGSLNQPIARKQTKNSTGHQEELTVLEHVGEPFSRNHVDERTIHEGLELLPDKLDAIIFGEECILNSHRLFHGYKSEREAPICRQNLVLVEESKLTLEKGNRI